MGHARLTFSSMRYWRSGVMSGVMKHGAYPVWLMESCLFTHVGLVSKGQPGGQGSRQDVLGTIL
jgi:hypothetical protein